MSGSTNSAEIVETLRNTFKSGKTLPIPFRIKLLEGLKRLYEENKDEMCKVLAQDLRKSTQESIIMEVEFLLNDVKKTIKKIREWVKPETPEKDFANLMDSLYIYNDPFGVVLVIGAWNYPLQLTLLPITGAIAAGNCVLIKPSELAPASAKFIAETMPKYVDTDCISVFNGGIPETADLLKQRFDYIFFTGSTATGKIVHAAANKYLTPTTLELGGKSPVYLDQTINFEIAARRILWGKLANAGQTCVAPDYVLCTKEVEGKFVDACKKVLEEFYGGNPKESPDLCRIINDRHFKRLLGLLESGTVAVGGEYDASDRYIAPTILINVKPNDPVMQDEIFGPILPIVTINSVLETIKFINEREKPLALYIFSNNKKDVNLLLKNTSSGGVTVNDTIMHLSVDTLPFGGVGMSGMGSYHGKHSFDTFSHKKSILYKDLGALGEKLGMARYPPYSSGKIAYLNFMLGKGAVSCKYLPSLLIFCLGYAASYFARKYGKAFGF